METPKMKYPQDYPRYAYMQNLHLVAMPPLPPNATPDEKEAYKLELDRRNVIRFDTMNALIDDVNDYRQRPSASGPQERSRPPMHPPTEPIIDQMPDQMPGRMSDQIPMEQIREQITDQMGESAAQPGPAVSAANLTAPVTRTSINRNKHESHCTICRHPEREAIEQEFIHWFSPRATAEDYGIDVRAIYRHAHAFNLFSVRNRKIRFVLSHALERAEHCATPTAADLNRMVRTFTRVNDEGQWIEPPSHVVVSSGSRAAVPATPSAPVETTNLAPDPAPSSTAPSVSPDAPDPSNTVPASPDRAVGSKLSANNGKIFSTHRAGKNSTHPVENNQNASPFLDTKNGPPQHRKKHPGAMRQ